LLVVISSVNVAKVLSFLPRDAL